LAMLAIAALRGKKHVPGTSRQLETQALSC
jgi:hypothetical protein